MSQLPSTANEWLEIHAGLGISLMDHLFNRFDGAYPNKWRASFPTPDSIRNWRESWAEKFIEKGITPAEVKLGLSTAIDLYEWPPSLPEFLKACRPPISPEVAYYEAMKQLRLRKSGKDVWSNKAIFWAAQAIGEWDMLNSQWSHIKTRWTKELSDFMAESTLPEIPEYVKQLPPPGRTSIEPEEAKKRIGAIVGKIAEQTDHRAWARKILENPKAYPDISRRFADEALATWAAG